MEIQQLRHFRSVAEHRSFTKAAAAIRISQQAISQSIRRLEETVGVRLLERKAASVVLTRFGELLLPRAIQILEEERMFHGELRAAVGTGETCLRLGVSPTAEAAVVPDAVRMALGVLADLTFEIRPGLFPDLLASLLEGRLDLFVSILPDSMDETLVAVEVLGEVEYVTVRGARQMAGPPWVMGDNPSEIITGLRQQKWPEGGDPLVPRIRSYSTVFTKTFVESGAAVTILPRPIVASEISSGRLVCIQGRHTSWRRPLLLCTRRSSMASRELTVTMDFLRQCARRVLV